MKKKAVFRNLMGVAAALLAGGLVGGILHQRASAKPPTSTHLVLSQLSNFHITLDRPTHPAKITRNEAKTIAARADPGYAKSARSVIVEYHLVTDPAAKVLPPNELSANQQVAKTGYLNKTPCYIVSYEGVNITPKGGVGTNVPDNHEYNVVIDANTGIRLFGFTYQ